MKLQSRHLLLLFHFGLAFLIVVLNLFVVKRFGHTRTKIPIFQEHEVTSNPFMVLFSCDVITVYLHHQRRVDYGI